MFITRSRWILAALGMMLLNATSAQAAFHAWQITQVYTNASGTLQFIEMVDSFGGQTQVQGQSINVTNGPNTNTYTLPGGPLPETFNHHLLFGTAGIQAAGGPAPDYTIPNGF